MGIAPLPIAENGARLAELENELIEVRGTVRILDVGSEMGYFMEELAKLLDDRQVDYELFGVDDMRNFGTQARRIFDYVTKKSPAYSFIFAEVKDLSPKLDKYFDYIFINAPYMSNYLEVVQSSMKLLKEDGYCVVRFHQGDEAEYLPKVMGTLALAASLNNWTVLRLETNIPQSAYPISQMAFFITNGKDDSVKRLKFDKVFGGARLAKQTEVMA